MIVMYFHNCYTFCKITISKTIRYLYGKSMLLYRCCKIRRTYFFLNFQPVSATSYSTLDSTSTLQQWVEATAASAGTECTICYERPIDSVLYMCGHMCMCYECAVQQWRGKGGGHCPLCRALIRDVIRTYKS